MDFNMKGDPSRITTGMLPNTWRCFLAYWPDGRDEPGRKSCGDSASQNSRRRARRNSRFVVNFGPVAIDARSMGEESLMERNEFDFRLEKLAGH